MYAYESYSDYGKAIDFNEIFNFPESYLCGLNCFFLFLSFYQIDYQKLGGKSYPLKSVMGERLSIIRS